MQSFTTLTADHFDEVKWHDSTIHAFAYKADKYEVLLDLDLITEWINGVEKFSFKVAPATLIFSNVYNLKFDIEPRELIQILNVTRENKREPKNKKYIDKDFEWDWVIECNSGTISLTSVGFNLSLRKKEVLQDHQTLDRNRLGYSFENC